MAPYRGPSGRVTTLNESIFSTIPGSPAYVGKAERFRMREPELGIDLDIAGHNAIQGSLPLRAPGAMTARRATAAAAGFLVAGLGARGARLGAARGLVGEPLGALPRARRLDRGPGSSARSARRSRPAGRCVPALAYAARLGADADGDDAADGAAGARGPPADDRRPAPTAGGCSALAAAGYLAAWAGFGLGGAPRRRRPCVARCAGRLARPSTAGRSAAAVLALAGALPVLRR